MQGLTFKRSGKRGGCPAALPTGPEPHTTHNGDLLTVHYTWHPWHGQRINRIQSRKTVAGIDYFLVSRGDRSHASRQLLPAWMFDPAFCQRCRIAENPSVSPRTLENLYDLLMAVPYAARIIKRRRLKAGDRHGESASRRGKSALAESLRPAAESPASASGGRRRTDSAARAPALGRQVRSRRGAGAQVGEGRV